MDIFMQCEKDADDFTTEKNIVKGAKIDYGVQNQSIGQILLDIFHKYGDYTGWTESESGRQMTYAQIKDKSIRLALWFQQQGIGSGDVITICSSNCLNNYVVNYAILYVGAVYNPWHHEFTLESARYAFKLTRPKVMFVCSNMIDTIEKAAKLENLDVKIVTYEDFPNKEMIDDLIQASKEEDVDRFAVQKIEDPSTQIAGLLFSSGTSGAPKCVTMTYQSLLNIILTNAKVVIRPNDVILWYSVPYWIVSTVYTLSTVFRKNKVIICEKSYDFERICQLIEEHKINTVIGHPNLLVNFSKHKFANRYKLGSLNRVFVSASKLGQDTAEQFRNDFPHISLYQGYGMTEHGLIFMQNERCKNSESVGHIVPNAWVKIVEIETGQVLGFDEQGEICCKSPMLTPGYQNNPEATAETIDKEGWLHTGDIGYRDKNGEFFIVDRIKSVIRYRFHHIYPSEITEHLLRHPDVLAVGVTSFPHEEDVEHAIAFVQRVPGSKVTEDELVEHSAKLGYYKKLWGGVKFLDALPRTASGKIATNTLKEMAKSHAQNY
ncbi:luciferin 4-monooxygenase isoform X2 [Nasonia vitripennis]|nr:luciferin 4-monooxygenase isoform X2 [Nasonia vitripennis]XP_032454870.1 luciferin 4-monooxygenase isoform X2 [Nasonia vitripennis]